MAKVESTPLPSGVLLAPYGQDGGYADCYRTIVEGTVGLEDYVTAFYTTWLIKLERQILGAVLGRPSTDAQARALGRGERASFAAWEVEARASNELLLRDFSGRTRSWLMLDDRSDDKRLGTSVLYFGSAIVPRRASGSHRARMGMVFHVLLGFHKLYSRALLASAARRLAGG